MKICPKEYQKVHPSTRRKINKGETTMDQWDKKLKYPLWGNSEMTKKILASFSRIEK